MGRGTTVPDKILFKSRQPKAYLMIEWEWPSCKRLSREKGVSSGIGIAFAAKRLQGACRRFTSPMAGSAGSRRWPMFRYGRSRVSSSREAAIDMVAVPTIAEVWVLSIALTLRSARFGHWTMGLLDRLNASSVQISVALPAARNLTSLNVQPLVSCYRDPIEGVGCFYRASATTSCVRSGESAERKRLR